ncbi:uncharacterized protein LOC110599396 isoform X1 [Ictidomys tridecemlineatus]
MGSLWRFYLSDLFTLRPLQIVNCSSHIPILACFPVEISIQRMCVFLCKTLSWITSTKKVLEIELRASGMQVFQKAKSRSYKVSSDLNRESDRVVPRSIAQHKSQDQHRLKAKKAGT